jgi:2,4-dienoyl-CoA reductase-like NADH-dependent reductase (Old Yellow Enzyme family)
MAPMTRGFADEYLVPTDKMAEYYARRAEAGLIISEGTIIRQDGQGYPNTPGIFNSKQIKAWRNVTDKVHENNGKIFCQLWHVGRVSHPKYLNGKLPVAPSAVPLKGRVPKSGKKHPLEYGLPRELSLSEIPNCIDSYIKGAVNSISAGFNGVEIHAAHGYLIDEFLHYDTNRRSDKYGGTPENMCRFPLKVLEGMINEIGSERIGIRLSPAAYFNLESNERDGEVFEFLLNKISKLNIAYLHQGIIDDSRKPNYIGRSGGDFLRCHYKGTLIGNGGHTIDSAEKNLKKNNFDLISFGKPFIANPDFVQKISNGMELLPYSSEMINKLF